MNYSLSCDFKTTPPSPTFLGDTANFITCVEVFGPIVMETFFKSATCWSILVSDGLHSYLQVCPKIHGRAQSRRFSFKSILFLRDIKTNVLPSNNDHYLEFHHGVPAHLVSVGVWYWIHSNQLGFISNSDSVET